MFETIFIEIINKKGPSIDPCGVYINYALCVNVQQHILGKRRGIFNMVNKHLTIVDSFEAIVWFCFHFFFSLHLPRYKLIFVLGP